MKSFVSFIILFRYRVYKKCVEVLKKSLRFGDFFAAQNDNSAQNQRDAEDALNRQRLVENKRSDDPAFLKCPIKGFVVCFCSAKRSRGKSFWRWF